MKKIFFQLLILLLAVSAKAQEKDSPNHQSPDTSGSPASHYLVFDVGGGLHFHTYKLDWATVYSLASTGDLAPS